MITVNLKPGARQGGDESKSSMADLRERFSGFSLGISEPIKMLALVAWVVSIGGLGFLYFKSSHDLTVLQPQLEAARADYALRSGFLAEKKKQIGIRDSIVSQIHTIRAVDGGRYVWPHILDEVANAQPNNLWFTEISVLPLPPGAIVDTTAAPVISFRVVGRTGDLQYYTTLLRQLEASPWLTDVMPISATTVVDKNRALISFIIQASFAVADSAHIRTVPILQSVVR